MDTVGKQILMEACKSMVHELRAYQYLRGKGLSHKSVVIALRKIGIFTKIRGK
jgi:hypothetical protein